MTGPLLTPQARRFLARLSAAVLPHARYLDRQFRRILIACGHGPLPVRAFLKITPAAAARAESMSAFLEQLEYNGRRLAKLNVQPSAVTQALRDFEKLLDGVLGDQFRPSREHLNLVTTFALQGAYYHVREVETQAFFGLEQAAAKATGLDDLLRRFVAILTRTFRARDGRLILLDEPIAGKLARPLYAERGRSGEALISDPSWRSRYHSYWSFPLAPTALVQFAFDIPYPWLPRELSLLGAVSERCREAIAKACLQEENRRLESAKRHAEEDERRRIGRELHDEAGQSLLALRLQLEMIAREAPEHLRARLAEAEETTGRTVHELRRIVAALSPAVLERLGLDASIRQLAVRFRKTHPAHLHLRLSGPSTELPRQIQEVVYRVAQESLHNIAKHSQATRVKLSLRSTDMSVRLSVSDNGIGFRAEQAADKPMSFGLAGMRERAELVGGKLALRTAPGKGSAVRLQLPRQSDRMVLHD